jgi:hypothetical protein
MTIRFLSLAALCCAPLVLALAGCGGSAPPTAAPSAPAPAAPASAEAPPTSAEPSAPAAPATTPPSADNDSGPGEALAQPPIDMITQSGEAFVIDFEDSDIGAKDEKACKGSNPAREAKCRERKHSEFFADVLQFKKQRDGKITFTIYKRKGDRLTKVNVNDVKLTQKSGNSVMVEITDNSHVPRVLFTRTRKFEVTVPNDYSVQLQDPRYGKLVYDGKVDILK